MTKSRSRKFADIMGGTFVSLIEDGEIQSSDVTGLHTVATSGSFNDLSDQPSPFDPSTLATVATSGAYSALSGTPTLGTASTQATGDFATAAQGTTADAALPKAGGAMTGAITTNSTFDGRNVSVDGTKLDGIESGATTDQTAAQLLTAVKTVDGSSSGLDADLLDGLHLTSQNRNNQANRVVRTQSNGYAEFGWINTTSGGTTNAATDYYVNTNDGYIRKKTLANVRKEVIGGSTAGSVGSYAWAAPSNSSVVWNSTRAGSSLRPGGFAHYAYSDARAAANKYDAATLAGTWRAMGQAKTTGSSRWMATLWLRIS